MAKLLVIKTETEVANLQYIGDVVGVYSDDHTFSDHEKTIFGVLKVKGTREEVEENINSFKARVEVAFLWKSDGRYHWALPEKTDVAEDSIRVYKPRGETRWYKLVNDFLFITNVDILSAEEKQSLETSDVTNIGVADTLAKMTKDLAGLPDNSTEIRDLSNTDPS